MKNDFRAPDTLSADELAAYAVPEAAPEIAAVTPEAVTAASEVVPIEQAAVPPVDTLAPPAPADGLTADELAAYEVTGAALGTTQETADAAHEATRRINMVGEGGELVDVAQADVDAAYDRGFRLDPSEVAADKSVALLEDGRVNVYDSADPVLQVKIAAGAPIATPRELSAEFGDTASQVAAGAEGLAQGVTLGGYGLLADAFGGEGARAERQLREAENPVTSTATNIVGAALPAVLSGGTSAEASAPGLISRAAAMTPAARLSRLGMKLAENLGAKATARGFGAGGRIAADTLAAGLEGAADNAIRTVADDLHDGKIDVTAERMLGAAWDGAKYAAILGAGASGVGEVIGRLRASRAADEALDELAPGAVDDAVEGARVAAEPAIPTRPRAEIDADLAAAKQRLIDAESSGDRAVSEAAEDEVARALKEQEDAILAEEAGLTPDSKIADALKAEPQPEVLGLIDKLDRNLNTAKNARELKQKLKGSADELAVSITNDLDQLRRFRKNAFDPATNRSHKPEVIRAMLEQDGVQWNQEAVARILQRVKQMDETLDRMSNIKTHATYSPQQLKEFQAGKDALKKLTDHLVDTVGAQAGKVKGKAKGIDWDAQVAPSSRLLRGTLDDMVETYHGLDMFKSHLGKFAAEMGGKPATTAEATFQRLYMLLRGDLQDAGIFGKSLADFQTVSNAAITRNILKSKLFHSQFARAGVSEQGGQFGFTAVDEYDPKKIGAMLDDAANPRAFKDERDFVAGLTSEVELMETLARYYPMSDAAKAAVVNARATLGDITTKLRANKEIAFKSAEADRLAAETSNFQDILNGVRGLPGVGAALSSARGLAASIVALGKGAAKTEQGVAKAAKETVKNLIEEAPDTARTASKAQTARKASAPRKGEPAHLAGLGITANALRRAIEDAQALEDPNSDESRGLRVQLEDIAAESPELAQAVEAKVREKAAFIASKVGPTVDDSDPFRTRPSLVDPVTERTVARYVSASRDPEAAMMRLARGEGTKEDKEVLQVLYPKLYEQYVSRVMEHVKERKVPPTMQQRQRLHFATGIPMSREQRPEYIKKRADVRARAGQEPQPKSDALKPMVTPSNAKTEFKADKHFASRSDAIMSATD